MVQRIMVLEDDREIMRQVIEHLAQSGYEVLIAHDGETALNTLRRERPDLMLMALAPPRSDRWDENRIAMTGAALAALPLVMLDPSIEDRGDGKLLTASQNPGIADHPAAPLDPTQIAAWVRGLLQHAQRELAPQSVIQAGPVTIDLDRSRVEVGQRVVHLTRTEFCLLRALAERPGHALTRGEMIEEGLGYSYQGPDRMVDSHIKNLRRKLDDAGGAAYLVETVFGIGYRLANGDSR